MRYSWQAAASGSSKRVTAIIKRIRTLHRKDLCEIHEWTGRWRRYRSTDNTLIIQLLSRSPLTSYHSWRRHKVSTLLPNHRKVFVYTSWKTVLVPRLRIVQLTRRVYYRLICLSSRRFRKCHFVPNDLLSETPGFFYIYIFLYIYTRRDMKINKTKWTYLTRHCFHLCLKTLWLTAFILVWRCCRWANCRVCTAHPKQHTPALDRRLYTQPHII